MAYEKRVCVMKQIKKGFTADGGALSGAIYAERTGERLKITPRLLGLAPVVDGRYVLCVQVQKQTFCLDFAGGILDEFVSPSIKDGLSILLCYARAGGAEPVAFGSCGSENASVPSLVAAVVEAGSEKKKKKSASATPTVPDPVPEEEGALEKEQPFCDRLAAVYDDEAIATGDYYALHEDERLAGKNRKKAHEVAGAGDSGGNEAVPPRPAGRTLAYYNSVREKMSEAFEKFPRDERLCSAFAQSEWVNAGEALLGIIYENGLARYLCVAREAPFPEGVAASFVPFTQFSDEEGMYVVFQDADTGAYVTVHDA